MKVSRIGKYELRSIIGRGGMGVVYKAFDPLLERFVALKLMSGSMGGDELQRMRFMREARSAAQLQHPNIVGVHDMGTDGNRLYIVMEYLEGRDLREIMHVQPRESVVEQIGYLAQAADGLHYAHQRGFIHRDIKPGNIRVTPDGVAKILDFGLARLVSAELTRSGDAVGTADYMSPEQIRGQRDIDARTDVYSLGVILYEVMCGCRPFEADTVTNILLRILSEPLVPVGKLLPGCDPQLDALVGSCLAKDAAERPANCADLARELRAFLERVPQAQRTLRETIDGLREELTRLAPAPLHEHDPGAPAPGAQADYVELLELHAALTERLRLAAGEDPSRHIRELYAKAAATISGDEHEVALATLGEILSIEPASHEARRLRDETRRALIHKRREEERKQARDSNSLLDDLNAPTALPVPETLLIGDLPDETLGLDPGIEPTHQLVEPTAAAQGHPTVLLGGERAASGGRVLSPSATAPSVHDSGVTTPTVVERRGRSALVLALGGLAVVATAVALWMTLRKPQAPVVVPGQLVINVAPWAVIESVTRIEDDAPVELRAVETPCILTLPPGAYRLAARNPFYKPMTLDVSVRPGQTTRLFRALPDFQLEQELDRLLGAQGERP